MKLSFPLQALLLTTTLGISSLSAQADVVLPSVNSQYVSVKEINPQRDAGYVVGDKLERTIILTVKKPYALIKESLPIVGYEHRYRGQVSGIELADIETTEASFSDRSVYTIRLEYQVFKSGRVAKPAILRGEIVKLRHDGSRETRQYRIPSFNFRTSPLSVYGEVNLKHEMSPLIAPFTQSIAQPTHILQIAAAVLLLSAIGLVYILGAYAWLPRMGGAFAKAYRKVSRLPETPQGTREAITTVHQALQQVAGHSVFGNTLDRFIAEHPAYAVARPELERFFSLSRQVFFDPQTPLTLDTPPKQWLKTFCRHLRDCERGLLPEVKA